MGEKRTPEIWLPRPRPLRFFSGRARVRNLVLAAFVVFLFYSFSLNSSPPPPPLPASPPLKAPRIQALFPREAAAAKAVRLQRQSRVKKAFQHAWKGYRDHAWLHDEVMPISGGQKDSFVGWAATLVDSLDSLYILGLKDEFKEALKALEKIDFSKPNAERVPVFEITIRYLGGLLGAWDISDHKYPILMEKAKQLGDLLYRAFDTPNGIPVPYYNWETHGTEKLIGENGVLIAQIGSLSLEFIRLSQVTGDSKYADAIQKITNQLQDTQNHTSLPGMWPSQVDCSAASMSFSSQSYTLGAWADSLFEYLPKTHLISPASEQYLEMYRTSFATFSKNLFFRPSVPGNPDILFSGALKTQYPSAQIDTEVQHLACFVGGMVGLGSRLTNSPEQLATARRLTDGCVWAYENTPLGIMPEIFHVEACVDPASCIWKGEGDGFRTVDDHSYQLRPEAIESVFIMYRLTADPLWQDKGWRMFQAIVKHTTTDIANARISDVTEKTPTKTDSMESFWLAETLKYFYLLYSEPELVSLDDFVLNTEAHPLRWKRDL